MLEGFCFVVCFGFYFLQRSITYWDIIDLQLQPQTESVKIRVTTILLVSVVWSWNVIYFPVKGR